ncbi:hypothetical protein [Radiobacillus sp. PE A8.2]|uniref:hypothetical protein n=1 Tax=Radiobacillus sp. PE A8.2 TaxID=3380349 RepID=UPI00388E6616
MKKRWMIPAIGAISAGAISYTVFSVKKQKNKQSNSLPIEPAGVPEKDNTDNAKMVSEGSQFGVNYYNRVKQ